MYILLLSLEKHKNGIWVTRLVEELHKLTQIEIRVVSIDDDACNILHQQDVHSILVGCQGIINRVSDAASAVNVKKTLAVLQTAKLLNVPVFNGPEAYGICCNKWCHHIVFRKAGLLFPRSIVLNNNVNQEANQVSFLKMPIPCLLKPNSGGFGAGIVKIDTNETNLEEVIRSMPNQDDKTVLLQAYEEPTDGNIYRVWFLKGRVQCAVSRTVKGSKEDLTSGCAAGVCSRQQRKSIPEIKPWFVQEKTMIEIETLLKCLPDAHAGSIEFLLDKNGNRLYFDLNLLSTLPNDAVSDPDHVWQDHYNPWKEFATSVLDILQQTSEEIPENV